MKISIDKPSAPILLVTKHGRVNPQISVVKSV